MDTHAYSPAHAAAGARPAGEGVPPAEPIPWRVALGGGALVALAMSTQLFSQAFVWRNFGIDEIAAGWLELLAQRLAVALPIALALALASRLPARSAWARALGFGLAIFAGAWVGEGLLIGFGGIAPPPDSGSVLARVGQWFLLALSIAALHYLWRRAGHASAAAQATALRTARLEREHVQARLQALRSQIEPHFLFNTLATVRRLHHTEPGQGAQMLAQFLAYLGATLPEAAGTAQTLGREIDLVRAYLGVVAVRMAGRLVLQIEIPAELHGAECPPLTIATLVENAVKHGIAPAPHGGSIAVTARRDGAMLEVVVADTGVGFSSASTGSGIGLANIRARLQTLYPGAGRLALSAGTPRGVRATMRWPLSLADPRTPAAGSSR